MEPFAYWTGMAEREEWEGKDVEVLLNRLRTRLTENTILKTPTAPLALVPFGTEFNLDLEDLAMRLLAVGGLHNNLKYIPGLDFLNTPHAVNYRGVPFDGNIDDFLETKNRFFDETPDPSIALLKSSICHIAKWTSYQQTFRFYNTTPFELWLVKNLNFSRELYNLLGINAGSSAFDILSSPATAAVSTNIVIHEALDILHSEWHQLVANIKNAALLYGNWHRAVSKYDPGRQVRLYTTNWDYIPELVAGINGWKVRDGFAVPAPGWYYPIAQPGIFSSEGERNTIDILKMHGGLDWCTNGVWTMRTRPTDLLTNISHLILEEENRPIASRIQYLDSPSRPINEKKAATNLFHHMFRPTPFASDLVMTNALIHPIDSKGYPRYEPMQSFARQLESDLEEALVFWIIGHSLADVYFINIIEKLLVRNQKLFILIQDPYPSGSIMQLAGSHDRILLFTSKFGDTQEIEQFLSTFDSLSATSSKS